MSRKTAGKNVCYKCSEIVEKGTDGTAGMINNYFML